MSTFAPFLFLFLFGFLPVTFHLHYHSRGKDDHFVLELRLSKLFVWRYEIPGMAWNGTAGLNQRILTAAEGFGHEETHTQEKRIGIDVFLANLLQVGRALQKYGLGGTFFYFFLPAKYRRWVTVEERLERRGRFKRFVWRTVLGGTGPAALGPATGLCWGAKGAIIGFLTNEYRFQKTPRIMVVPGFREKNWETMLDCIFEIKLGHIIVAGIKNYLSQLGGGKQHAGTSD